MIDQLLQLAGFEPRSYLLRVPRAEENEGLLLLGDPGTGKSQVIHQLLAQIALRRPPEAVVCYDPAGEFIRNHFDAWQRHCFEPTRCALSLLVPVIGSGLPEGQQGLDRSTVDCRKLLSRSRTQQLEQ